MKQEHIKKMTHLWNKIKTIFCYLKTEFCFMCNTFNFIIFMASIVLGLFAGILIISIGLSALIKTICLVVGVVGPSLFIILNIDQKYYKIFFSKVLICLILSFCVLELCLYSNSGYEKIIPIKVVVDQKYHQVKNVSGSIVDGLSIPYKTVSYYNLNTNKRIGYKTIEIEHENTLPFLSSIKKQRIYIEYLPFLRYKKQKDYLRRGEM